MLSPNELKACIAVLEFCNQGGEVKEGVSNDVAHAIIFDLEERKVISKDKFKEEPPF